ncbi:MAG: hypothetical protein WC551_02730 [Patescibacteria group bacterium]
MESTICCACGVPIVVEASFLSALRRDGRIFFCPSGHPQSFSPSQKERLEKLLEAANKEKDLLSTRILELQKENTKHKGRRKPKKAK